MKATKLNHFMAGTGRRGFLHLSKRHIRHLFGKPSFGRSEDGKVNEEWVLDIGGTEVRIYDYHSGYKRLPMNFDRWHIGGKGDAPITMLKAYLDERGYNTSLGEEWGQPVIEVNE